jgi:hypothetical protein
MIEQVRFSSDFQRAFIYDKSDMGSVSEEFLDEIIIELDKELG